MIFELPIVLGIVAKGGAYREFFLFSPHRLNLARRSGSKPPLPFGAGRGQWASAGGAATRNVADKLGTGRDVESTTAETSVYSDLDT